MGKIKLFDGFGNPVEIDNPSTSHLAGADVILFGDSNIYYSAGFTMADVGSFYQRLNTEFKLNSWSNLSTPGKTSWNMWGDFNAFATPENAEKYNKETTYILIGAATNDKLESWTQAYNGNPGTTTSTNAVGFISKKMAEVFPKANYAWLIPTATEWSKWTGNSEPDDRNMTEKYPLIVKNLEKWNFPYCDFYTQSGITPAILPDGVHLGGGGYNYTLPGVYKYYTLLRSYLMTR